MNRIDLLNKINEASETNLVALAESVFNSKRQVRRLERYQNGIVDINDIRAMVASIANSVEYPTTSQELKDSFTNWFNEVA